MKTNRNRQRHDWHFSSTTLVRSLLLWSHPGRRQHFQINTLSSPNVASSLWRYSSIVADAQMWEKSGFYHPVSGEEERSGRWRKWFLFNLGPPKWKEAACWQASDGSPAGSTGSEEVVVLLEKRVFTSGLLLDSSHFCVHKDVQDKSQRDYQPAVNYKQWGCSCH